MERVHHVLLDNDMVGTIYLPTSSERGVLGGQTMPQELVIMEPESLGFHFCLRVLVALFAALVHGVFRSGRSIGRMRTFQLVEGIGSTSIDIKFTLHSLKHILMV